MADKTKHYKLGTTEKFVIHTNSGINNVKVERTNISLDSPMPFEECGGEFTIIDVGTYSLTITFDELGEFLYRVTAPDDLFLFKFKVVEQTEHEMVMEVLRDISGDLKTMVEEDLVDDERLDKILKVVKMINYRM